MDQSRAIFIARGIFRLVSNVIAYCSLFCIDLLMCVHSAQCAFLNAIKLICCMAAVCFACSEMWKSENCKFLPLPKIVRERIRIKQLDLSRLIELDSGLICELYARGCISQTQKLCIEQQQPCPLENNRKLLEILSRKSFEDFNIFISCLMATKQQHIVDLLASNAGIYLFIVYSYRSTTWFANSYEIQI
jgi:hypothetical protein